MARRINISNMLARFADSAVGMVLATLSCAIYLATLLPGIGSGDTAEFQRVAPALQLAHPTGYPLYTMLGWLWSQLPFDGTPAWRMNAFSAVIAAAAVGMTYRCARGLNQRPTIAIAAAATLATSGLFWAQATIAEVYALAVLLQATLVLALLRWRAGRWPLWVAGLALGLCLAHHRMSALLAPAIIAFVALTRWPRPGELAAVLLATASGGLWYLYLLLHAPAHADPGAWFVQYVTGAELAPIWLDIDRFASEAPWRMLDLAQRFIWAEFTPAATLLALIGTIQMTRRQAPAAALLLLAFAAIFLFACTYYAADVEVFLVPAHAIMALLLGAGGEALASRMPRHARATSVALLIIPALLLGQNLATIRAANTSAAEREARALIEQPYARGALLIGDWNRTEALRYLQVIEGHRPDLEIANAVSRSDLLATLQLGRAVYLLEPDRSLGLEQYPEAGAWRVVPQPLEPEIPADLRWSDGIALEGLTLHQGPYQAGDAVPLTLAWQAHNQSSQPYVLFVHLVAEDGTIYGQEDRAPLVPTDRWQAGDRFVELLVPQLSATAPPGRYTVNIGWYSYPSLERLPLADAPTDYASIGTIELLP